MCYHTLLYKSMSGDLCTANSFSAVRYSLLLPLILLQISMSVFATPTAVLTTAPIMLGPIHVVVGMDTGWPPISSLVKVGMVNKLSNPFHQITSILFFQTSMSVASTLMAVLTIVSTPLDPTHVAVELDTDY